MQSSSDAPGIHGTRVMEKETRPLPQGGAGVFRVVADQTEASVPGETLKSSLSILMRCNGVFTGGA